MDIEGFRKAGYAAVDRICEYYYALQERPVVSQVQPGFLTKQLPETFPEEPEPWEVIQDDFENVIMPGITHWQHPSFFAYYPANTSFEGILGDMWAAAVSNPGFNWSCSPSVTELEQHVMDQLARAFGLSSAFLSTTGVGGGAILGGASEVALVAAIAARERAIRLIFAEEDSSAADLLRVHPDQAHPSGPPAAAAAQTNGTESPSAAVRAGRSLARALTAEQRSRITSRLVIYGTTQTHSLGAKAGLILGLPFRALPVSKEDDFALRGETLRKAIEEDAAEGKVPFFLIATVGTTSSGAVDRMDEIVEVLRDHPKLFLHVDAAYAGVTLALPEMRKANYLDAINSGAYSYCTNLHKWGLVNFDASCLFIRDRAWLEDAFEVTPEYLKTKRGGAGQVTDYRNWSLTLGRRFRSIKVWFVLRSHGLSGLRAHLRLGMRCAQVFRELVESDERFELCAEPRWSLVVFRLRPRAPRARGEEGDGVEEKEEANALNISFYAALSSRSDLALTQTMLPGEVFCVRLVVGSPWTREEHVHKAWAAVVEEAERTLAGGP